MNKEEIKEELRRSACEDYSPYFGSNGYAFYAALEFRDDGIPLSELNSNDIRTFFLLCVKAL